MPICSLWQQRRVFSKGPCLRRLTVVVTGRRCDDVVVPPEPRQERSYADAGATETAKSARLAIPSQTRTTPQRVSDDWWQTGVVYQVYPRSFADGNGDGIGDLRGIIDHLDHLNDGTPNSLGVDAVWLSPIYPSPDFDFGYDVADYVGVDPKYGTLADFEAFVEASHRRGLKVILDLVLNHSSHLHPWFESSRSGRSGPHAEWYIWADSPGRSITGARRRPNNWQSFFGGSAWSWDETRQQFYMHTFLPEQPDLNWRNPEVRAALMDVVGTWLERGVDGFRLDVFNVYFKDMKLRSNPWRLGGRGAWSWQDHIHDRDQPELAEALAELRALVDSYGSTMTVGELFDETVNAAAEYVVPRHLIFDWLLITTPWSAARFRETIRARQAAFGPDRWPANVLSNHDQPRHISRFAPRTVPVELGDARAKVAAALLLTVRGTAFMYYGEEIGQRNLQVPNVEAFDPPARRSSFLFPWWNRDQARGPMSWRDGPGAGFTTARPWLPAAPDAAERNVARQSSDPDSVLSFYRRLIALRRSTPAIGLGDQEVLDVGDADVLAYARRRDDSSALVLLNFASREATIEVPQAAAGRTWRIALSTHRDTPMDQLAGRWTLRPLEALVAVDA
jgi:alpha-glucosidase